MRKDGDDAGIYYTSGTRGPRGNVRVAAWSPDGSRVVFHRRLTAPPTSWLKTFSRHPDYELAFTSVLPSFNPAGDRFVMVGRPQARASSARASRWELRAPTPRRRSIRTTRATCSARSGRPPATRSISASALSGFFNGFANRLMSHGDRIEGGAQIAVINPDGSGFREITSGANNNGFPSMAPDGKRIVYRTFGPDGEGLRIMDIATRRGHHAHHRLRQFSDLVAARRSHRVLTRRRWRL